MREGGFFALFRSMLITVPDGIELRVLEPVMLRERVSVVVP